MHHSRSSNWARAVLLSCGLLSLAATGCQTNVGGQTMPSAYYLRDDVQYYPVGPEDKIYNERKALAEYKIQQQSAREGLNEERNP